MELRKYIRKYVKVDILNGFYYEGEVISADDDSISLIDKFGKQIDIAINQIAFIREVEK